MNTAVEHILNVIWMLFGVSFYQVLFGQITSITQQEQSRSSILDSKLKALEEFQKEVNLSEQLYFSIRTFLVNNYYNLYSQVYEKEFLDELPMNLKEEILYRQYGNLVETVHLLRNSEDNDLTWELVQHSRKISMQ